MSQACHRAATKRRHLVRVNRIEEREFIPNARIMTATTKTLLATAGLAAGLSLAATAQTAFTPGRIAVLRIGDGKANYNNTNLPSDWTYKQNPIFIDEFDPGLTNASVPTYTVAIPTNGDSSLFLNGNAGTEGGMARSADRSVLTTTGYHGDILSQPGTPSGLPYLRGISVIDAFGQNTLALARNDWYGFATGKTNPRGVVSDDGANNFWGSGNVVGTLYYNPGANDGAPQFLQNLSATRTVKIIGGTLYTTVTGKDSLNNYPSGVYNFVDFYGNPTPLPTGFAGFHLVVPAYDKYTNIVGFYLNPQQTIAYLADLTWGVQKYVKTGGQWQFACNYTVDGFEQTSKGLVITNDAKNTYGGCFDVVADFSGTNPVLYATTWDYSMYSGNANSNRVVRIVDTNTTLSGLTITNAYTVIARATGTNIGFRSLDFTPDLRPLVTSVPEDQSVVAGSPVSFSVSATASATALAQGALTYQWYKNTNTVLDGQTSTTLTLSPDLADDGSTYQCVVTDHYGSVTSAPPATLTVTAVPVSPYSTGAFKNITNAVGDNVSITVSAAGTSPLSYQWFAGSTQLSDTGEFAGTTNKSLVISGATLGADDNDYNCVVTNSAGSTTIHVAKLYLVYPKPAFSSVPSATTVLSNTAATFTAKGFGYSLAYTWYSNSVAVGSDSSLTIDPARTSVASIVVVITNPGGSVTSAPVALTVIAPPPHSAAGYTNAGQVYLQNFDSLPVATNNTVNSANPVLIYQLNSANPVTYSIDDPFDFAFPILATGGVGGLGLSNTMPGWYGWGQTATKFAAQQGDQSTGGVVDFGTLNTTNLNLGGTNRALGLLSTSTTGSSAFGLKLLNRGTNTLTHINLSYLGEVWRNQPRSNSLVFSYYFDSTATNAFSPTNTDAVAVPDLNVSFNTNAAGLLTLDGTQSSNQLFIAVTNLPIGAWAPGVALWLVWQQLDSAGGAQGLAIDNLSFSAVALPVAATLPASGTTATAAALRASVTPSGSATAYWFEYGTTAAYGSASATNVVAAGASQVLVTNLISGLSAGATYHYHVVATNVAGVSTGEDMTFTTTAVSRPTLGGATMLANGGFQFTFTNTPGLSFRVLATNDISAPVSTWPALGSATEVTAGHYSFTHNLANTNSRYFYILVNP
jgi:hypothetical protein